LIPLLVAASVAGAAPPASRALITAPATRSFAACPDVVTPEALVCRALDAQKNGKSDAAAESFEEAAKASPDSDPKTARMWAAAGNLWIAANQPTKAAADLDKALALPGLEAAQRGEALLDRARAAEAQNDLATARAKLNEAGATIGQDPFYWYFSASLAMREGDRIGARSAIDHALKLAPTDPTILFEAGHVADYSGDDDQARRYWEQASAGDPNGPIGRAAAKAIEMLGVTPTVKTDPPSGKAR
jgi:tetratricopeptide (TPR) repeat protein